MAVITMSRQFGTGGRTLGQMIANELDYQFLDDLIIQELAETANVSIDFVKSMERTAGSKLSKAISGVFSRNYMERIIGTGKGYIDENIYVQLLQTIITRIAEEGNAVIVGRGGQFILRDFDDAFHLFLVADEKDRIKFMEQKYHFTLSRAAQVVKRMEKRRANLYDYFGRRDFDDLTLYDLTLNMSLLGIEQAETLVCGLVKR